MLAYSGTKVRWLYGIQIGLGLELDKVLAGIGKLAVRLSKAWHGIAEDLFLAYKPVEAVVQDF